MLKEIYCEKFIENGKVRPIIQFHNGLNTIVGAGLSLNTAKSENSVGKSTLLMIIDFAFGGEEFLKSKAVEIVGDHTICFAFEFDGKTEHFMRITDKKNHIYKCDEHYQNPQNYSIEDFKVWLKEKYKLQNIELGFRDIVGTYFRFYGEKDISPREILRTYNGQNGTEQIRILEKLFEKYSVIKDFLETIQTSINRDKIKQQASRLKVELEDFKKIDIEETQEKIEELTAKKEELLKKQNEHIPQLDAQKAKELAQLKAKHKSLASKRSRLLTRIENIQNTSFETVKPSKASYDALLEFFPNADIKKIEEIDSFHEKLNSILSQEHEEALVEYESEIENLQNEIEIIENQIANFGNKEDFTTAFLLEFSRLQEQIDVLNDLLKKEADKKKAAEQLKVDKRKLQASEKEILSQIEYSINQQLALYSNEILGKDSQSIEFHFPTNASYSLGSSLDDGTGTDYTSMILFDLAVLRLTKLPSLIHDSYLISNIRGTRLENLIKEYSKVTDKQIFLSIDETEKLSSDTAKLVNNENTQVIKLTKNGGELYGYYWGKKTIDER